MTADGQSERMLRTVLREQRPPSGASDGLRARVLAIPAARPHQPAWSRLLHRWSVPLAATAVSGAALMIAAIGLVRAPVVTLPPGNVGGSPSGFDPSVDGLGLVVGNPAATAWIGTVIAIVAAVAALGALFGSGIATTRGRITLIAGVAVALVASGIVKLPSMVVPGGSTAVLLGAGVSADDRPFDSTRLHFVTAAPGETFVTMFSVRNASAVPVRIEGVVVAEHDRVLEVAHWTSVWLDEGPVGALDRLRPFEPRTIAPDGELHLYLVGRAGPCAFGPSFNPDDPAVMEQIAGYAALESTVTVAFTVFGLASSASIDTGQEFAEPSRMPCVDDASPD